jgi:hypothetical protein
MDVWTTVDQARADAFEQQILGVAAQLRGGHPDVIVVAFLQTVGSLMRQRLREDATRLPEYQRMVEMLADHVNKSVMPDLHRRPSREQ